MKRIFLISFVLLYACLVSGMRIQVHYCLGQVKSISLIYTPTNFCTCPLDADGNPMPCCQFDQVLYASDELPSKPYEGLVVKSVFQLSQNRELYGFYVERKFVTLKSSGQVPISFQGRTLPGYLLYHSLQYYG